MHKGLFNITISLPLSRSLTPDCLFVFTIGRLDRLVYVPPPTLEERVAILRILKNSTRFSDTTDLYTVGNLTSNFTGADMKALVRKAGLYALKDNRVGSICCSDLRSGRLGASQWRMMLTHH